MKHILWPIVILIIAVLFTITSRYAIIVKPPVVLKVDQFTGDSWIVNSGYWVKVNDAPAEPAAQAEPAKQALPSAAEKKKAE